jgi:ergothioneine biosynthesis protein EgtB
MLISVVMAIHFQSNVFCNRVNIMNSSLFSRYINNRQRTLTLIKPLCDEDCCVQSLPETSPIKWHLGHIVWFFENFILQYYEKPFKPFSQIYRPMFSSYNAVGQTNPDPKRGLFTRPPIAEILHYCENVNERINQVLIQHDEDEMLNMLTILGMNHELQHQELILTDVKHLFSQNPLNPSYHPHQVRSAGLPPPLEWYSFQEGIVEIGHNGNGFSYDNESPRHQQYLQPYQLASRLITNGEYLQFMEMKGYDDPKFWLSEGMDWVKANQRTHPLYWQKSKQGWKEFTLSGLLPLDLNLPVIHLSYYEADAFARCFDSRLPTETEWENAASEQTIEGSFADNNRFHPAQAMTMEGTAPKILQLFGDAWEWTQSSYSAYPRYCRFQPDPNKPMSKVWDEAVGEYNSRSMVNKYVLRGGSSLSAQAWIRPSFRNFLPAKTCIHMTGLRLARDV